MDIGSNLRKIRTQKGYSQEYVADSLHISQKAYSQLENNKTQMSLNRLERIAEVFEMSVLQMLDTGGPQQQVPLDHQRIEVALGKFNTQLEQLREEIRLLRSG